VAQSVRVERFVPVERESPLDLTLAQAIAASDAMDSAVRKATELGVAAIQPLITARSAPLPDGERGEKRVAHWRQVAAAAAEQSGRNRIPHIAAPRAFADWLAAWPGTGIILLPGASQPLAAVAPPRRRSPSRSVLKAASTRVKGRRPPHEDSRRCGSVRGCCEWTRRWRRRSPSRRRRGGIGDDAMDALLVALVRCGLASLVAFSLPHARRRRLATPNAVRSGPTRSSSSARRGRRSRE
jgi:hypothetical protein